MKMVSWLLPDDRVESENEARHGEMGEMSSTWIQELSPETHKKIP